MPWRRGCRPWLLLISTQSPVAAVGIILRHAPLPANSSAAGSTASSAPARPLVFVGFDASEPLVDAMRQGKIHGLVVQNPLKMGKLSVLTMVKYLEKQTGREADFNG